MSKKIRLVKAARVPLRGPIRPTGFTATVDEDTYQVLRSRGVVELVDDSPALATVVESGDDRHDEEAEEPAGAHPVAEKFGPLPKKTQGINAWREYARDNDIDVRGLSEKSELMGHIIKVVNS